MHHLQNPICRILPHLICFQSDGCLGLCQRIDKTYETPLDKLDIELNKSIKRILKHDGMEPEPLCPISGLPERIFSGPVQDDLISDSLKQYVGNVIRDAGMNYDSETQGDFYEYIGEAAIKAVREYQK